MILETITSPKRLRIDFGSGHNPKEGYKTCDITFAPNLDYAYDKEANLIIDLEEASVDEFYAKNVLHHSNIERVAICFSGNLDSRTSGDILGLLKATSSKFHQTIVMITHNNEIAQLADRIIRIEDGRITK